MIYERQFASTSGKRHKGGMALIIIFLLGIANFALHRAVLESGHDLVGSLISEGSVLNPKVTLGIEFIMLLAAMLLVTNGYPGWGWAYAIYSIGNGLSAWLILSGRL